MATTLVQPGANTAPSVASNVSKTTTERFDQAFGFKITKSKDEKGAEITKKEPAVISVEDATELEKSGEFEGSVITVSVDYPANWEGLLDMGSADKQYKDDEGNPRDINEVRDELVKLLRAGSKTKVMNRMRAILTKQDDKGNLTFNDSNLTNGVLDLTGEITSGSKRVFLTEEQKTWRALSNLPEAVRKQMYDVYLTSIGKKSDGTYPAVE